MLFVERKRIVDLATSHRLPSIAQAREFAELGGLMAYGASIADLSRRSATYVDKILKGANPADLPVEQPTKFELVINLMTASPRRRGRTQVLATKHHHDARVAHSPRAPRSPHGRSYITEFLRPLTSVHLGRENVAL